MTNGKTLFHDWRESRRIRAWELKQLGWKQSDIAQALGVTKGAVSQWLKRAAEGGKESLRSRPTPGRPARLDPSQKAQIPVLLDKGPEAFGFPGGVWTAERVAQVIERTFGVRYHPDHVGRLLRDSGWNSRKPARAAGEHQEVMHGRWPASGSGRAHALARPSSRAAEGRRELAGR